MLDAREVGLTAQRELRRNLRSTKGIAMFVLFFLGGLLPSVIQLMIKRAMDGAGVDKVPGEARHQMVEQLLTQTYGNEATGKYLAQAPLVLLGLLQGTIRFLPFFILLIGFDQIAGEIQHRTIRYSVGRAERASLVLGKALGVYGVIAVMILVLHLTVWILLIAGGEQAIAVLSWGSRFWIFSMASAAAYVGFTSLVSAIFRTPTVALFVGAGLGFALWLTYTILGLIQATKPVTWLFPNAYEHLLMSPDPLPVLGGMALLLSWGAACVAGSSWLVRTRDV